MLTEGSNGLVRMNVSGSHEGVSMCRGLLCRVGPQECDGLVSGMSE